jgi:hypothetical protein
MRAVLIVVSVMLSTSAFSQQQAPDPTAMQRAITILQAQRNQASDQAAAAEIRATGLADDLAKAQATIKGLEEKEKAPK